MGVWVCGCGWVGVFVRGQLGRVCLVVCAVGKHCHVRDHARVRISARLHDRIHSATLQ